MATRRSIAGLSETIVHPDGQFGTARVRCQKRQATAPQGRGGCGSVAFPPGNGENFGRDQGKSAAIAAGRFTPPAQASQVAPCMTAVDRLASLTQTAGKIGLEYVVGKLFLEAIRLGLWGLLLGPTIAAALVLGAMIFDPKCGAGNSGGCAMGLLTVPLAAALPSAGLAFALGLARGLWRRRPGDLPGTVRRLRNWGRED